MDLGAPARRRLPIRLLLVLLTVLVVLTARSSAEVITLTEETFSDKVTPAVHFSWSLFSRLTFLQPRILGTAVPFLCCADGRKN